MRALLLPTEYLSALLSRSRSQLETPTGVSRSLAAMKQELWSICFSWGSLIPPHLCHIQHLTGFRRGFHRFKASSGASSSPGSCVGGPRRWYGVKWSVMPQNGPHIQTSLHIQQLAAFFSLLVDSFWSLNRQRRLKVLW